MREVIACGRHDEMEVAIRLGPIAFGDNCLERGCRLLECNTCLVWIAAKFEEAQPQPKQAIGVTVEIEAELRRECGCARGEDTVAPDHGARLAARDEPAAKPCRRGVGDGGYDRVRAGWHRL